MQDGEGNDTAGCVWGGKAAENSTGPGGSHPNLDETLEGDAWWRRHTGCCEVIFRSRQQNPSCWRGYLWLSSLL